MSTTIDQRVVEMKFDNKHFENNVQTSLSTLDKLKKSLDLNGAAKGLENVNAAAKNCNMSGLSGAVETVRTKFSALEVMAVTALANITNSAVNYGKRIVTALTIDPIKMGFSEYETQINAIQTILANTSSKGTTLEQVNSALDELNKYADMTIYNFTEMTRNIGTFTAAGVDLNTSVSAIKGISNLAAVSGSTSQQASTAMYQLSQALASGTVKLMDWNSVVNAGMGGQVFQDALKETARVHGIAIDEMINDEGSFRETLSKGWLTSDILTETLSKFTGDLNEEQLRTMGYTEEQIASIIKMGKTANDAATKVKTFTQLFDTLKEAAQSGWTQSWEIIVGDFEEAKELLTEISDVFGALIGKSADARNEVLTGWKELGGRTAVIEAVRNAFEGIISIITPVKEAFNEVFPPITAEQLAAFSEGLKNLTSKLKLSDETSANLKSTFKGLFAVLDIIKQAFSAVFNVIRPLFDGIGELGSGILGVTASWGDWLVKLNETIKTTDIFNKSLQKVVEFIKTAITKTIEFAKEAAEFFKPVIDSAKQFFNTVKEKFAFPGLEIFHAFLERVHERMSQVGEAASSMKSGVVVAVEMMGEAIANGKFLQVFEALWKGIKIIAGGIAKALGALTGGLVDKISNADFNGFLDIINSLIAGGIGIGLTKFLKSVTDTFKGFQDVLDGVVDIFDGVRGCLEAYQTQLKAGALLKIAAAIGILAASILVISLIDSDKLSASLGAVTVLFADLMGSMAIFTKISGKLTGVAKACATMLAISFSVLILASALKKIADLEFDQLVTGLVGIVGLTATMVAAVKIMGSGSSTIIKGTAQMVIFAAAIKVLASACEDLSKLSWEELAKGLVGVGVLMAEIVLFLNTAKFSGKTMTTATGIVILAAAIKILASACSDFAQMQWGDIGKGLAAIGILLGEITIFTKLTGNAKHVISTGIALIAIGAAMKIFASAIQDMSGMSWDELARGLVGMAGALAAVTIAVNLMPKNMVGIGVGLIAVSTALLIMAEALENFGEMSWDEIARGLVALGGAMAIMSVGLNVMKGTLGGSAALLVAAAAILVLTPALSILGAMSWESIIKGLVALAGAFAVIGVAGLVLTPLVPTILALSGAFALIGVGVLAVGAGLLAAGAGLSALAIGFTALATAGAAGATAIVASLTVIITGVASLIPTVIEKIGEGLIAFCGVIAEGAPAIGEAVKAVVLSLVDVLVECVPAIVEGVFSLVDEVLKSLVKYTPSIIDSIMQFLIELLNGIARNLPELIQAAINVLMAFFEGIVDALSGIDTETLLKGIVGIGLLSAIMIALSAVAALVPGAMIGVLGMGAVIAELALVLAAIGALAQIPGLSWLINEGGKLMEDIGNAIGSFIGGIVGGFMTGISAQFPPIGTDLSAFMTNVQPFIEGASKIQPSMLDGVLALAGVILALTAANILDGLTSWFTGGSSIVDFGKELAEFGPYFNKYYESIKGIDGDVVVASANAAKSLSEMAANLPNSGGVVDWFTGSSSLTVFAEELTHFGPKLKAYADSVKGLDAEVVINSANAAKALAEMANNLPNNGGVVDWFTGSNSLVTFGEELVKFGPVLKEYADSVEGLDAEVIENSANAAKALSEMAVNLPNKGEIVEWFSGDKTLSTFGKQLEIFAPSLKKYANSVRGLDSEIVVNSANAAKALSELANNLPNTGGVVSWFTGDNDIGAFGESLIVFGKNFSEYSDYMKNVKSSIVTATTNAANSIVELQKSLPKNGGWFSDDKTLAEFGKDMSSFGSYFNSYYSYICDVNTTTLNKVIKETKNLVDLANDMEKLDTKGMTNFGSALKTLGKNGADDFIKAFTDSKPKITSTASDMLTIFISGANDKKKSLTTAFTDLVKAVISALKDKQGDFKSCAQTLISNFIDGVKSQNSLVTSSTVQLLIETIADMKNKYNDFKNAGSYLIDAFKDSVKSKASTVKDTFAQIVSDSLNAVKNKSKYNNFYNAGVYLVDGFANGIKDNTYKAEAKAKAMASAAAKAAEKELKIKSPSKVTYKIGNFFGAGFVNAIEDNFSKSQTAGEGIADSAKKGLSKAVSKVRDMINGGFDSNPTIRPVFDLSNIQNGAGQLYRMMNGINGYAVSGSVNLANQAATSMTKRYSGSEDNNSNSSLDNLGKAVKELIDNPSKSFENTFNITGTNAKEIAEEVSRIIQRQVERRDASWA